VDVLRLVKVGEALAKGQAALAGGDRPEAFVEARREEERALARLAAAARELAEREGVGEAALPRAAATLRAASLTDEGRDLLRRGRLTEELEPPGFEALAGIAGATPTPRKAEPKQESRRARAQARERVRRAQAEERKLVAAAQAARRKADDAASRAAELQARAEEAEASAAKATREREAAESDLARS
jgi:colicin import membrane protein